MNSDLELERLSSLPLDDWAEIGGESRNRTDKGFLPADFKSAVFTYFTISPNSLAPQLGLEPRTFRLTAECSAIELLWNKLATLEGFEPSAYCLEGSCSIQLSYKVIKLVGVEGIEPTQGGHLPQRDYKSLSQSNAHSDRT